ncbi:TIGR00341 family protein [Flavihumibacter sp. RY-1]|uniref:TIGR00341 family protein n=1 Tax=Flavihumibacter fluminis TaxID=2909236 RepID=A0ABS9BIN1_9BACT|nr:TIGR00341 family protein [Flavihumibacter fluminis]MCF1715427.1 TIGR00341 family protein [Flavihumibacter fluminis]
MNKATRFVKWFLWDRFNLHGDAASPDESIESFKRNVDFKGTNLWILIFAIFIASIGLNVNSTAVIIGAMLISPLMGPIMGFGLGISINDFQLVKRALRNLAVAVFISICTSTLYFWLSPLSDAQSELLARTSPNLYDVLIAFFGGLAGVVAGTRKEKSNVIPGVAIATALMPPLCTAGYGIASGQWSYFLGAFYLFIINSVFISLSVLLIVRFLKFPRVSYINDKERIRVRNYIWIVTMLTLLPSIYFAYRQVQKNIYQKNAQRFIDTEMQFNEATLLRQKIDPNQRTLELVYVGIIVPDSLIEVRKLNLPKYELVGTNIRIRQIGITDSGRIAQLKASLTKEEQGTELTKANAERIQELENQVKLYQETELDRRNMFLEAQAIQPKITSLALENTIFERAENKSDTLQLVYLEFSRKLSAPEAKQLQTWVEARLKTNKFKLITEPDLP